MRQLFVLGVLALATAANAAVKEGENLLLNGSFEAQQASFPEFWNPSSARQVEYRPTGGPGGESAAVVLLGDGNTPGTASARQQGLTLVEGESYKLTARIKTRGFKSRNAGLVLHNAGWTTATGFTNLPADSDWTLLEKTFKLFPSKGKEYGVAMFAIDLTGEIHFADLKLEAVSEGARQGSSSQASIVAAPRLVPVQPLLYWIPQARPELTFKVCGLLPDKPEVYECEVAAGGDHGVRQAFAVKDRSVTVSLAGLPPGEHALETTLRHRKTGEVILKAAYPIRILDLPVIDHRRIRPLNTLVSELLNEPLKDAADPQAFTFVNPRDGWVFVALETSRPSADLSVSVDGQAPWITAATARLEAFREIAAGEHRIAVHGNAGDSRLVVRSIPEIFDYPPCTDSFVKENGSYGWEFMKRHILPAVTTLNGGQLPGDALAEARAMGLKWLANFGVNGGEEPAVLRERMEKTAGMTDPRYDGFTSDELFFARNTIDNYTQALWTIRNPENRLIYTWIVGKPSIPGLHTDFMSAALNASQGRGRLLFEAYCHPQTDEKAAAAYLDETIAETMRRFNAYFPNAAAGTGIIFGNFNQIPIISLEHDPAVDFKYFLDMQVNLVANNPEFANLATTGYWGTYYGDEELVRWSFKLMRHYAVEGNREMLSARYGFSYKPGLVVNGDFADGLDGWNVVPAATDTIRTLTIAGYGKNSQSRWGAGSAGDTVCAMTRREGAPNRISQTAQSLKVGQCYCLQFVTGDLKDITEKKYNPRQYGIDVELEGADVLADKSFVHIDRRKQHHGANTETLAKINLHRIVFRARSPSLDVVFSDALAKPGEELVLNFVQLKPYLEE